MTYGGVRLRLCHWFQRLVVTYASGAHARFVRFWRLRCFGRALEVARCFAQCAQAQPPAIMRSMLTLCLALCVFGHCFAASSLRIDRHGLARDGGVGTDAFMLVNGKTGAQEMCLTIADGVDVDACAAGLAPHAFFLIFCKASPATLILC